MHSLSTDQEATVANPVVVTRVTIDYVCDGRTFTMVFNDPSTIDSIVLGRRDFNRLREKQLEQAGPNTPPDKAVQMHRFNPLTVGQRLTVVPTSDLVEPVPALPISISGGTAAPNPVSVNLQRSLWWHNESCTWVHPEGDA